MRKTNEEPLKVVIDRLLESYKLKQGLEQLNLTKEWEGLVGTHIAKHTQSVQLKNNKLYVSIDSEVLRNELAYGKSLIIQKVNDYLGREEVKDVVLR